jgi:hypothetical protein
VGIPTGIIAKTLTTLVQRNAKSLDVSLTKLALNIS